MWIYLDDEESKFMLIDITDKDGKPTGKQRILILLFDLYSKKVDDGTGIKRITIFAYEIRTSLKNNTMLKNVL